MSDNQAPHPFVDMAKLSEGSQREQEIKKIAKACEEWGFFQGDRGCIQN
jgi:isopenicillin N synthase-like dioxygenase